MKVVVHKRNLYIPREWKQDRPAAKPGGTPVPKRPRWEICRTEIWILDIHPAAQITRIATEQEDHALEASLGWSKSESHEYGITRMNDKFILNKHLVASVWVNEPEAWGKLHKLEQRAAILAEWTERCGFWPFDL